MLGFPSGHCPRITRRRERHKGSHHVYNYGTFRHRLGLNSHAHSFPDCLFRGSPKRQWSGWSLQSRRKMRCPGRATLRQAAARGAVSGGEEAEGGVLLLPPQGWTSCKSQSKLFLVACDASRPPRAHAPHLYTLRTCPPIQRVAPGW